MFLPPGWSNSPCRAKVTVCSPSVSLLDDTDYKIDHKCTVKDLADLSHGKTANNPTSQGNPEEVVVWRKSPGDLFSSCFGAGGGRGRSHYHLPFQGAANPAEKSLLVFHTECSQPPWEAGRGPATSPAQPSGHRNPPVSVSWGGRGGKECGLRWRRGLWVWLCSLFLAMLLIRSGTLGDSFNLSLSQIQTSTSSYYNIWLHYGIVERLN